MQFADLLASSVPFSERQLAEVEALDAIYPEELTIAADEAMLSCTIALEPRAHVAGDSLEYTSPAVVATFPPLYPESDPPLVRTVGLPDAAAFSSVIDGCLEENAGEEVVMQLVMALNEHIQELNDGVTAAHAATVSQRELELEARRDASILHAARARQQQDEAASIFQRAAATARVVLGRRVIYSHHISSPAKQKDIRKVAAELELGGYAKVGKPGVIVIEGAEEACRQYCPRLVALGWKFQQEVGEETEERAPGAGAAGANAAANAEASQNVRDAG
jgi:hypothetical protein